MNLSEINYRRLRPGTPFHMPLPAQPVNTVVTLKLEGPKDNEDAPEIVLTDKRRDLTWHVIMQPTHDVSVWQADVQLPMEPTIVYYHFKIGKKKLMESRLVESRDTNVGNRPVYGEWMERPYHIAVYDPKRMPPEWSRGMVVYQVFPDRFARAQSEDEAASKMKGVYGHEPIFQKWSQTIPENPPLGRDFYGGDLRGLISKLDYLHDMGVECLYLNPLFEASSNHRYEAIDFLKIDQMLGTDEDFDSLIAEAHKRGIRIILDGVFNHCSSDSIYFDITGKFGNGATQSPQSPYYRWFNFEQWPDKYTGWIGLGFMPQFVECPEMEAFFLGEGGITQYWLERGIDGWRLDVTPFKSDVFWQRFRKRVDAVKPDAWTVAEEWRDATNYLLGDMYSATMNYRLAWAVRGFFAMDYLQASEFDDRLQTWMRDTPEPAIHAQMNLLDSHDTDRMMTANRNERARFMQAYAFLLAFPGAPTVFYGTETGIEGTFPEDSRRPMPWENLDEELVAYFKKLMTTRRENAILRQGDYETVLLDDERQIFAFARHHVEGTIYAIFNTHTEMHTAEILLPDGAPSQWHDLLGDYPALQAEDNKLTVTIKPRGAAWYTSVA